MTSDVEGGVAASTACKSQVVFGCSLHIALAGSDTDQHNDRCLQQLVAGCGQYVC